MESQAKQIGRRMRELRTVLEITPEEMARVTGVTPEEYLKHEAGEVDSAFSFLYQCAERFKVDISMLADGESPKLSFYTLTRGNRGDSFVFEGGKKNAGIGIDGLSERFRDPVLSDLRLVFASSSKADAYPRRLKNLYRDETLEVTGRVPSGVKELAFSLKGLNGAKAYEGFFRLPLESGSTDPKAPALWREEQAIDSRLR